MVAKSKEDELRMIRVAKIMARIIRRAEENGAFRDETEPGINTVAERPAS